MTGIKETTMEDLMSGINQIMDRLSEIEIILNDPMHGIELPEGLTVNVESLDDQPSYYSSSMGNMNDV
tara:strand:+ start:426 stop:629 length:204 start_codon:yes stop_codon:yes gene_type:complete